MTTYWSPDHRDHDYHITDDCLALHAGEAAFDEEFIRLTNLWREVIRQAAKDVQNGSREAIFWLQSQDFILCCQLANLDDPDIFREALLKQARRRPVRLAA